MPRKETYLTPEGLKKLRRELDQLLNVRRKEVASRIQEANEIGGTVDNAEYDEAKNEQAFIEGRILTLESMIKNVVVIQSPATPPEAVALGSRVTVIGNDGKKEDYLLVGSTEADPLKGKISNESPVGRALLGHKVNDDVEVSTPAGVVNLKIVEIK